MHNICFLCLDQCGSFLEIADSNENDSICSQIQQCLQLKLQINAGKSLKICTTCAGNLKASYEFFIKIHRKHLDMSEQSDRTRSYQLIPINNHPEEIAMESKTKPIEKHCPDSECNDSNDDELATSENETKKQSSDFQEMSNENKTSQIQRANVMMEIPNWKLYPLYCSCCIYSTLSYSTLVEHVTSKHSDQNRKSIQYQCIDCKKICDYVNFLNHVRSHRTELRLCCDVCSQHFENYEQLSSHRAGHTIENGSQQPSVYQCTHCFNVCLSSQSYNKHLLSHENALQCQLCKKSFKKLKYLKRHMEMHKELKYKCTFCDKTFHRRFNQINHERTHTNERPYKCEHCDKCFSFQSTLKAHLRIHSGDMPYECDLCGRKFRHHDSLKEHKRKHSKETPYECEECAASFSFRKSLNRHMRSHIKNSEGIGEKGNHISITSESSSSDEN